jgi:hypothetical protein
VSLVAQALDTQLDLLRWYNTAVGAHYANIICSSDQDDADKSNFGADLHRVSLTLGETFAVTSEILDVLESAMTTMPDFGLHNSDLPGSGGFAYLERPVILHDSFGKTLVVKAVTWHRAMTHTDETRAELRIRPWRGGTEIEDDEWEKAEHRGIVVIQFTDPSDPRDHMHTEWRDARDRIGKHNMSWSPLWSLFAGAWDFEDSPHNDGMKFLACFFRFLQTTWVDPRVTVPDRPVIKRAKRHGVPEPQVKVVQLRRRERRSTRDPNAEPVEWQHRWIVSPHWRNQWFPKLGVHKQIPIAEYIKGPEDKPLIVHDKIYLVDR